MKFLENRRLRIVVLSAVAVLTAIAVFIWGMTIGAWFAPVHKLDQKAQLTSFAVNAQVSTDGGNSYTNVSEDGVAITKSMLDGNNVRVRISYKGVSAAYIRVKVYGYFYNTALDNTRLPLPEYFWTLSGTNWTQPKNATYGDYAYYMTLQSNRVDVTNLDVLTVSGNWSNIGTISTAQPTSGKLYVVVDAVQPDRYPALWGIDSLPSGVGH